jgi:hypothetical protein
VVTVRKQVHSPSLLQGRQRGHDQADAKLYTTWFWSPGNCDPDGRDAAGARGGNYAFVKQLPNGNFVPLYFGEAEDLQQRIPNHERWDGAKRAGATHVMAHVTPNGVQARLVEERDLIQYWNPPLNTQHRQVS